MSIVIVGAGALGSNVAVGIGRSWAIATLRPAETDRPGAKRRRNFACGQCRDRRPVARHHRTGSLGGDTKIQRSHLSQGPFPDFSARFPAFCVGDWVRIRHLRVRILLGQPPSPVSMSNFRMSEISTIFLYVSAPEAVSES